MTSWLLLLALGTSEPVVDCRPNFPSRCTAELKPKEQAPFHGVLVSPPLAAHLYLTEKNEQTRIDAAVKKATETKDIEIRHQGDLRQIERTASAQKLVETNEAHARELANLKRPWYVHPAFLIPLTAAATLGSVWLAIEVLEDRND